MKKLYTILSCILICLTVSAQDLVHSRKTSFYTYIFQLTDTEARTLYQKDLWAVKETFFHTVVDSFPTTGRYTRKLPLGHYLMAHAEEDQLVYRLHSVGKLQVKVLNNKRDLVIHLHDSLGNFVADARVKLSKKNIRYDARTQTYRLSKTHRQGLLAVEYQGFTSYHTVSAQYKAQRFSKIVRRVVFGVPLGYVTMPFYQIYSSIRYWSPQGWIRKVVNWWEYQQDKRHILSKFQRASLNVNSNNFIIFNKPRYLPKDTIKLKAILWDKKNNLVTKELDVWLEKSPYSTQKEDYIKLGVLKPLYPGAFEFSFVLTDSLKLKSGNRYSISFLNGFEGVYVKDQFKYEDYELKVNTFTLRLDKKEYTQGEKINLFVKGTDENELNVMDARVRLKLYPQHTGEFDTTQIIVADTLWRYEQKMEAAGETKITVPDSVLPNASMDYRLEAVFLNANNERHSKTQDFRRLHVPDALVLYSRNDSLIAEYKVAGLSQPKTAELILYADNASEAVIHRHTVQLPYRELMSPYAYFYKLRTKNDSTILKTESVSSGLQVSTRRTADSVWVQVSNPRRIPFWYTVYHKNNTLTSGSSTENLDLRQKASARENYYASVQYIWNNQVKEMEYAIPLAKKQLRIEAIQPETVSPGQTVPIQIQVRDYQGKPVPNVDLTAYGVTRKFSDVRVPYVPDFSKQYRSRKLINTFNIRERLQGNAAQTSQKLQWQRWHQEMGLDTVAYFQFLYPKTGVYTHSLPMSNLMTQIAPFVVINGVIEPIHLLFIDKEPRYFQVADVGQRYSFHADSGYHSVQIRTRTLTIKLDSVYLKPHQKLILSIDPGSFYQSEKPGKAPLVDRKASDVFRKQTHIDTVSNQLSASELAVLNNYTMAVRSNFTYSDYVYLRQDKQLFMLNTPGTSGRPALIGPVKPQMTHFVWKNSFSTNFLFESGFEYDFKPQLLKMRTWNGYSTMTLSNYWKRAVPDFSEKAWTVYEIDSLTKARQTTAYEPAEHYNNPLSTDAGNGTLQLRIAHDTLAIRYYVLYHNAKPGFVRIIPAYGRTFYDLEAGLYCLVALMADSSYLTVESIKIQKNATTYRQLFWTELQRKDSYSRQLLAKVKELVKLQDISVDSTVPSKPVTKVLYPSNTPFGEFRHYVQGRILDDSGAPLPGVSVVVKGTSTGISTNSDGLYSLYVAPSSVLVFSFIGFVTQEEPVKSRSVLNIQLTPDIKSLSEIVVTGYGIQRKVSVTGSVSTVGYSLQGKAAGVTITQNGGQIRLRGVSSIAASQRPLIVIDGVPYFDLTDVDPSIIASAEVLKDDESAVAIYGSRAANGVILITSKPNSTLPERKTLPPTLGGQAGNSIRSRFSDYAFWQPRLRTDQNGQASFQATFPDDITNWRTFVVAVSTNKQTGVAESSIRAFKSVAATLAVPRFLLQGDSTQLLGKALNYTPDTLDMQTAFEMNEKVLSRHEVNVANVSIDSLMVTTNTLDSLKVKYFLQQPNGYTDGEVRSIPVFPVGTIETKGQFWNLEKDTTIQLHFDPALGKAIVYARAQVLDILLDEIDHVHRYEYLCNEQAASKVKLYLADKRIRTQLAQPFTHDADIRKAIRRMEDTQQKEGTWGWWKEEQPAVWVTTHVIEALMQAREAGYAMTLKTGLLTNYLVYQLASPKISFDERIRMLKLLKKLNAVVDFQKHVTTLDTFFVPKKPIILKNKLGYTKVIEPVKPTFYQYLQRMELRQAMGLAVSVDTIFNARQQTMFGSSYWGEPQYHPFINEIQTTLLVYRILKATGGHKDELRRIRNYFFEKRETGYWRNTYESAQILETILADVLGTETTIRKAELVLANGTATQTVSEFPFAMEVPATSTLTVSKTGTLPVYITGYQQFHNATPAKVEKEFIVRSSFKGEGSSDKLLKKGEKVTLQVSVEVTRDADYVLVEIPIPAGCSYDDENSSRPYRRNETYREAFRHKTAIYCSKLNKGRYIFTVDLTARYTGTYTLNPAKAELMYFPTFYGRTEVKKVQVK